MPKFTLTLSLVLSTGILFGQTNFKTDEKYLAYIGHASHFYKAKDFHNSALAYDSAFAYAGGKGRTGDFYDAACSWAQAGNKDSAFRYLDQAIRGKWSNDAHTAKDSDLISLHNDKRWSNELDHIRLNRLEKESKIDKPLGDTLNQVYTDDQFYRRQLDSVQKKYGPDSKQMQALWKKIEEKDSIDLEIVTSILNRKGWLGPDEVGQRASEALWLVIQHADSLTQVTWLPVMKTAVEQGKAQPDELALLEDRILVTQGKKQIYGSQVHSDPKTGKMNFFPIEDEPNVNKRRATVGLGPLEEYGAFFGIDYHLPAAPPTP